MRLLDLVAAQEALGRLLALDLPAAVSYKIARAARAIQAELRDYEQERVKLIRRLGTDNGQGQVVVLPENTAEFNEEFNALLDVSVEAEIRKVKPDILGDANIKPGDLMALWFLFEEEEDDPGTDSV